MKSFEMRIDPKSKILEHGGYPIKIPEDIESIQLPNFYTEYEANFAIQLGAKYV